MQIFVYSLIFQSGLSTPTSKSPWMCIIFSKEQKVGGHVGPSSGWQHRQLAPDQDSIKNPDLSY